IRLGEDFYLIEGTFLREGREEQVVCSVKKGQKKVVKRNGKLYDRLSEHIGTFPIVMVSPSDRDLIHEGSEARRKFLDGMLSQVRPLYLQTLLRYNQALTQRNSLLKLMHERAYFDPDTVAIYDDQLSLYGQELFKERKAFLEEFLPIFQKQYQSISQGKEQVSVSYFSPLEGQDFKQLLSQSISQDRAAQYTTIGVHKDDLVFTIEEQPVKKFASQGQQKSFLIALKFAQFLSIYEHTKVAPILLLDDIFDKLDSKRVGQLLRMVTLPPFSQVFLSDTDKERTEQMVKEITTEYQIFTL
ncbi:MAG: DNA replication/repair protein RecF, partial [Capnocytophaga granulosa]